jgi:hypothetical protein
MSDGSRYEHLSVMCDANGMLNLRYQLLLRHGLLPPLQANPPSILKILYVDVEIQHFTEGHSSSQRPHASPQPSHYTLPP